jgi:hypothetical protein
VSVLLPYQSARFQQIKLNVDQFDDGPDVGETDALATLERLLDAYAVADEEERRFEAAREVKGEEVAPEPSDEPNRVVALRPRGQ